MSAKTKFLLTTINMPLITIQANSKFSIGWHGPGRTGIFNENSLLLVWPSTGTFLLWESLDAGTDLPSATATDDAVDIRRLKGSNEALIACTRNGRNMWGTYYGN